MNHTILCLLILLMISFVAWGYEIIPAFNDQSGCILVDEELHEVESTLSNDQSRESGEYEVYTCCGKIKLYVQLKKDQYGKILIEGWSVRDTQKRLLKIEIDEQQVESTPGGSGATAPIIRIRAKKDGEKVACFYFFKRR